MPSMEKQMHDYLNQLIKNYLFIVSLDEQLDIINSWLSPDKVDTIYRSAHFFKLVDGSFYRTILIELCKLVDYREKRSLVDWLKKAKKHTSGIKPMRSRLVDDGGFVYEAISDIEYSHIIDDQLEKLNPEDSIIKDIITLRDKVLAHADNEYFEEDKKHKLFEIYPRSNPAVRKTIEIINDILKEHYLYIFKSDIELKVYTSSDLSNLLISARAFDRFSKDSETIIKYKIQLNNYLT